MAFNIVSVLNILNWSPLLRTSNDYNFDSIGNSGANRTFIIGGSISPLKAKDRISLLAIDFGENKYYVCSFVRNDANNKFDFKCFENLNFYTFCKKTSQNEVDLKTMAYKDFIVNASHTDIMLDIQTDFLKEKFNQNKDIKSTTYNKINNYVSINLAHIAFIGYIFTEILSIKNHNNFYYSFLVLFSIAFLYTVNYSLLLKSGLSVKPLIRSTFKDLKQKPTNKQLATSYYTDWFSSNNEQHLLASIVCNIEVYFIRSLVLTILSWLTLTLLNTGLQNMDSRNEIPLSVPGYVNESLLENKISYFLDKIFPNNLLNINNTNNDIQNSKEHSPKVKKKLSKSKVKSYKKTKIKVKIIDNNTVLIKYKD